MDARLKTPDYELLGQASGMTEKTTVRSQLLVNFNINIVVTRKVTDYRVSGLFIYNSYATGRLNQWRTDTEWQLRRFYIVCLDLSVEVASLDVKYFGGLRDVPVVFLELFCNEVFFE
jgi:hypothetical protein